MSDLLRRIGSVLVTVLCVVGFAAAAVGSGAGPSAADPCGWRRCEIDDDTPLRCTEAGQVCDMFRNRCVAECEGDDCCAGTSCPPGTACAPAVGRCGVPAGSGCFDMGTTWWTGRDLPPDPRAVAEEPSPVTFELVNGGDVSLYFAATWHQPVRFDLFQDFCGREQKLEIPENHFCTTPCPPQGIPRRLDCRRPPPTATRLFAGETLRVFWSGTEEVRTRRICEPAESGSCEALRGTLPGTYTVEVCAYTEVIGGRASADDPGRRIGATLAGERLCRRVGFVHPAVAPIKIHFDG